MVNYYGEEYLKNGFGSGLDESDSDRVATLTNGIRAKTRDNPRESDSEEVAAAEADVKNKLGRSWFFDDADAGVCDSIDVSEELRRPTWQRTEPTNKKGQRRDIQPGWGDVSKGRPLRRRLPTPQSFLTNADERPGPILPPEAGTMYRARERQPPRPSFPSSRGRCPGHPN